MKISEVYTQQYPTPRRERSDLFAHIAQHFGVKTALYPGSYTHITPSFYIPEVHYVDISRQALAFFECEPKLSEWVADRKHYEEDAKYVFHHAYYHDFIRVPHTPVDLLISLYSDIVSYPFKPLLKPGGLLLVNNSQGDAGVAHLDPDYELAGVFLASGKGYRYSSEQLDLYFQPKSPPHPDMETILHSAKGVAYTRSAYAYVFVKKNGFQSSS